MALTPVYINPPPVNMSDFTPAWPHSAGWEEGDHPPTHNPDGVTMSSIDYVPKTQEEKAELMEVEFAQPIEGGPNDPYPIGDPIGEDQAFEQLSRMHSPMELVPSDEYQTAMERNLAAGGSVELDEARRLRNAL